MERPIGYYVHHQGDGHRQRALAIARAAKRGVTLLGTGLGGRCGDCDVVDLPDDRIDDGSFDGQDGVERPEALHYAPVDHDGVRRRVARIAEWTADAKPALMVVDVSVEVAMLARLASTPTVYVRLSGRRFDRPHLEAFRGAVGLLAPFHAALDDEATPPSIRRKTFYGPGLLDAPAWGAVEPDVVLGVVGKGGGLGDGELWADAARSVPEIRWQVIGRCTPPSDPPPNLERLGWVEDAPARIAGAAVVVGGAGDGVVSAVIAAGRPYVCMPQARPFDEQTGKAARLAALGAAVVCEAWPSPQDWRGVLARARGLDASVLAGLSEPDGPRRVAGWLESLAGPGGDARP